MNIQNCSITGVYKHIPVMHIHYTAIQHAHQHTPSPNTRYIYPTYEHVLCGMCLIYSQFASICINFILKRKYTLTLCGRMRYALWAYDTLYGRMRYAMWAYTIRPYFLFWCYFWFCDFHTGNFIFDFLFDFVH